MHSRMQFIYTLQYLPTSYLISVIGKVTFNCFQQKSSVRRRVLPREKELGGGTLGRLVPLNTLHARLVKARDRHAFTRKVHSCALRVPERE